MAFDLILSNPPTYPLRPLPPLRALRETNHGIRSYPIQSPDLPSAPSASFACFARNQPWYSILSYPIPRPTLCALCLLCVLCAKPTMVIDLILSNPLTYPLRLLRLCVHIFPLVFTQFHPNIPIPSGKSNPKGLTNRQSSIVIRQSRCSRPWRRRCRPLLRSHSREAGTQSRRPRA